MSDTLSVDTLEAKCLRITDNMGRTRCTIKCDLNGNPFIDLCDAKGKSRIIIASQSDDACSVTFYSRADGPVLVLTTSTEDEPRIWLYQDGEQDPRIGLLIDKEVGAYCHLWHPGSSDGGIVISALSDGTSEIRLHQTGERTASIECILTRDGQVQFKTSGFGKQQWTMSTSDGTMAK